VQKVSQTAEDAKHIAEDDWIVCNFSVEKGALKNQRARCFADSVIKG